MRTMTRTISPLIVTMISVAIGCGDTSRPISERDWLDMQQDVRAEREAMSFQRDQLEDDRREFDQRERNDPVIASSIEAFGLLVACVLPLAMVLALFLLRRGEPESGLVCDVLLDQTLLQPTSEKPSLGDHRRMKKLLSHRDESSDSGPS
jgi:hypothetical protein